MATGWGGADPVAQADAAGYELGNEYLANADLTISAVRLWGGPSDVAVSNRKARIWSSTGAQLGQATLPNTLTAGWATYTLDAPVTRMAGSRFYVTYTTGGNYGALTNGLNGAVNSADGNVTCLAAASSDVGNGAFNTSQTQFPNRSSPNNAFYGNDFVYTLGIGGNQPPTITSVAVAVVGQSATVTISATSPQTLVGATYRVDWGDGTTPTVSGSASAQHTYALGDYAVLASVTDVNGLSAYAAAPVEIEPTVTPGFDAQALTDGLVSLAQKSGRFVAVTAHEPIQPPGAGVIAAVWLQGIGPARKVSGLSETAARVEFMLRLYTPMITGALDAIDPAMATATATMIGLLSADFTLGGEVYAADLLGAHGMSLSAKAGYVKQADSQVRIVDITIPLVVDNVWSQAP